MKQRVAFIATLLTLVVTLAFFAVCGVSNRNTLNDATLEEMSTICRLSANALDSAAFDITEQEAEAFIRKQAVQGGLLIAVYAQDGDVLYTNRASADTLTAAELLRAADGPISLRRENRADGQTWLYAAAPLEGGYLSVGRPAYTYAQAVGGARAILVMVLLAMGAAVLVWILFELSIIRSNRLVESVEHVLEDFSEGNFDSRIQGSPGDSLIQTARFNEIMGRIQDRIFRQKTHNQALNSVLNHIQNGILAVDDQFNVILVTPTAKRLFGITGQPEGQPINLICKDVKLEQVFEQAMQQEGVYTAEVAARTTTGRGHRPIRLYVSSMMKDEKAVGAIAIVEDITELRRLEQVRTDFAANVSHELKTPLTSIKGFVETLQNGAIDNPEMAHKFLRIIMLEADRLTRLINDILSISKLESGEDEVSVERIRLDKVAYEVADMLSIHAGDKEITIHAHQSDEPLYIMGNPDRVEQMLINLIENGIKYNQPGGSVSVSVFASGDNVNLTVADTGIGIAEEHIPRLFERFYRVDKGRSRSMGGTGLGLAIVKHIVRTMGGMIEIQSKPNEGTEFLITLPRAAKPPDEEADGFEE